MPEFSAPNWSIHHLHFHGAGRLVRGSMRKLISGDAYKGLAGLRSRHRVEL